MNKQLSVTVAKACWSEYKKQLRQIRTEVFIEEQHVSQEDEWDGKDTLESTSHFIARIDNDILVNVPIACARLEENGKIGRMAVLKPYRDSGIGSAVLKYILNYARKNEISVFLYAQLQARGFYQKHNFVSVGEVFDDAGIPHIKMLLDSRE